MLFTPFLRLFMLCSLVPLGVSCARSYSPEEKKMLGQAATALDLDHAAAPPPAAEPSSGGSPVEQLKDQNDKLFFQRPGTTTTVLIMVNSKWRDEASKWSSTLLESLPPSCQVVHVLDLQDTSRAMSKFIAAGVRVSAGGEEVHVYMDWDGTVVDAYKIPRAEPVVIALDESRQLLKLVVGGWSTDRFNAILAAYNAAPYKPAAK